MKLMRNSQEIKGSNGDNMKVVFVCTGNTCRSPMAEAIFKDLVRDAEVISAGIYASYGEKAAPNAIKVCEKYGLDLTNHSSQNIGGVNLAYDDLILTAEYRHKKELLNAFPNLEIRTINEYAEYGYEDIADPIDGDFDDYENCFLEIRESLEKIVEIHDF